MTILQIESEVRALIPATVLLVATGPRDRGAVVDRLGRTGLPVTRAGDVGEALRALARHPFAICVIDLTEERAAIGSIQTLRAQYPALAIVGIIDSARPLGAAEAIHAGVSELLPWPFEHRDLAAVVANAHDRAAVDASAEDAPASPAADPLIAHSPAMRHVCDVIAASADERGGVLICGEPSTGREVAARAIHAQSGRAALPFVAVDCRSLPPDDLEMQLFGVLPDRQANGGQRRTMERISRTSALYLARGGTLFVANVVEAPARSQAKLARLLRDREAVLPDKRTTVDLDVRPIAAVAPDPEAALADGRLRRDLFERLSHVRIEIPPLRRRGEDIPLLVSHFLRQLSGATGALAPRFTRSALTLLSALPWPGNGRELRLVVEALVGGGGRSVIELDDVLKRVRLSGSAAPVDADGTLRDAKTRFERDWISAVLIKHQGRVGDAARALGIQRTNLYRKVRQLKVARALLVRKV